MTDIGQVLTRVALGVYSSAQIEQAAAADILREIVSRDAQLEVKSQQLESLGKYVTSLARLVDEAGAELDDVKAELAAREAEVATLDATVDGLDDEVEGLRARIDNALAGGKVEFDLDASDDACECTFCVQDRIEERKTVKVINAMSAAIEFGETDATPVEVDVADCAPNNSSVNPEAVRLNAGGYAVDG